VSRPVRSLAYAVLLIGLGIFIVTETYRMTHQHGLANLRKTTQQHLQYVASDLATAIEKFNTLPVVLASHPELIELLKNSRDSQRLDAVNRRLKQLAQSTRVSTIYLIDINGQTLASSNWATPGSFVGENYAFRPYFIDAVKKGLGRYYAVGVTTGEPGYFLAHRIEDSKNNNSQTLGVIAVKISLDEIEANWSRSDSLLMLVDTNGVIFLASKPTLKFHTLDQLATENLARIRASQQYGGMQLDPLPIKSASDATVGFDDKNILRLAVDENNRVGSWISLIAERRTIEIGELQWVLLCLADIKDVVGEARRYAVTAGFAYGLILLTALYALLRRRRNEERKRSQQALERMSAELEQRIGERTAVLTHANDELAVKIRELDQTQNTLRATQDQLIQAGKLTVLGQMAASVTHEINQPLTALRALNENAILLLNLGDEDTVRTNLLTMSNLTQRIAAIVAGLKGFARKDDLHLESVALSHAISTAISLVEADAQRSGVRITTRDVASDLTVQGQILRVEQILVNLLRNGIDACREFQTNGEACIEIQAFHETEWVNITITDNGPGIPADVLPRLFEPFFTTKSAHDGLGLGLAISGSIATALGGTLQASNRADGGAVFALRLRVAAYQHMGQEAALPRTIG
jgi:two-component system, NtrC family, C4-dicarboxylate transport sensor histidine kinase DctB